MLGRELIVNYITSEIPTISDFYLVAEYGPRVKKEWREIHRWSQRVACAFWGVRLLCEGDRKPWKDFWTCPTQVPPSVKAFPGHYTCWGISLTRVVCIIRSHLPLESITCLIYFLYVIHTYTMFSKYICYLKERSERDQNFYTLKLSLGYWF